MSDRIGKKEVVGSAELILTADDHDCALELENLRFNIHFEAVPGEPKISWQQSGDSGLNLLIRGDTTNPIGTFYNLSSVGTLHGRTLNLTLIVRGIGSNIQAHAKLVSYNFTLDVVR
jgi:hypothetical protein